MKLYVNLLSPMDNGDLRLRAFSQQKHLLGGGNTALFSLARFFWFLFLLASDTGFYLKW